MTPSELAKEVIQQIEATEWNILFSVRGTGQIDKTMLGFSLAAPHFPSEVGLSMDLWYPEAMQYLVPNKPTVAISHEIINEKKLSRIQDNVVEQLADEIAEIPVQVWVNDQDAVIASITEHGGATIEELDNCTLGSNLTCRITGVFEVRVSAESDHLAWLLRGHGPVSAKM